MKIASHLKSQLDHNGFGTAETLQMIDDEALDTIESYARNNLMKWLNIKKKSDNPEKFRKYYGDELEDPTQSMIPLGVRRLLLKAPSMIKEYER